MLEVKNTRSLTRFMGLAAILLWLAGCVSAPVSGSRPQGSVPSGFPDAALGAERSHLIDTFGGLYRANASTEKLVRGVVDRIVAASDDPAQRYRITFLNSPSPNAFALPNCELYLTRGLLALANDTSELAAVLAHEVAHVTANHAIRRAEVERAASSLPAPLVQDGVSAPDMTRFVVASFSRGQELEADEIGIRTIAKAGYDPYGAARFLSSLARQTAYSGVSRGSGRFSFLSSHPSTPQRIAVALEAARDAALKTQDASGKAPIEADRATYLQAINGLAVGDDPSGGVVRGRRFLHPRFDFTLTAPEGFTLENSSEALIGLSSDGSSALRLDILQSDANPEVALASGWIDGVRLETVDKISINGFDGATALATSPEWNFRLTAIRKGPNLFRIIYAARTLTPALDKMFQASIGSFRALEADEAASLRPQHIEAVQAGADDTVETFANRISGVDRPLDQFLLLNGLERPRLKQGEFYKILVTD